MSSLSKVFYSLFYKNSYGKINNNFMLKISKACKYK